MQQSDDTTSAVGKALREWRKRRRLSQLDLALEAEISTRHLSFLETGRARPSREMVLHLADTLDLPLRARNEMLLSAGFAPAYAERSLDHPTLRPARAALQTILKGHEPNPALAIDRQWRMVAANAMIALLIGEVAEPSLLEPPVNVMRLSLHPGGLRHRIENFADWHAHALARLRRDIDASGDPALVALEQELGSYPPPRSPRRRDETAPDVAVTLVLRAGGERLCLLTTTTVFGTPTDVTLSELAIESFFPADEETGQALRRLASTSG
jgi:transcriptional regulator with XRE-family HTH domain